MDENDAHKDGYLILTRRPHETLRIGEDIRIHVVSVGNNVRLSIEAPADQRILRSELLDKPRAAASAGEPPEKPQPVAEPAPPSHQAAPPPRGRQQPVVRYRRRRRLELHSSGSRNPEGDTRD